MSPVRSSVNERSAPRRGAGRAASPGRSARRRRSRRCSGIHRQLQLRRDEALAQRGRGEAQRRLRGCGGRGRAVDLLAEPVRFQAGEVVGGALALAAARERDDRAVAGAHQLLELRLGLGQRARGRVGRLRAQLDLLARPTAPTARSRVRAGERLADLLGADVQVVRRPRRRTPRRRRSSGRRAPARAPPRRAHDQLGVRRRRRSSSAPKRSSGSSSAMSARSTRPPDRRGKAPRRGGDLGQLAVLDRELGGGRDLDLLDVAERALRERREPAQRLDLDVEHVDPHGALLGRREDVEQAAAQRELAALLDLLDALVAGADERRGALVEVEQLAHAQRERVRAQLRVGDLLRQRHGADDDDRLPVLGRPRPRRRRRAARRAPRRAGRRGAAAARGGTRRRRRARGSSARAAAPARRAGRRQVAGRAVVADDDQRRARRAPLVDRRRARRSAYGRSDAGDERVAARRARARSACSSSPTSPSSVRSAPARCGHQLAAAHGRSASARGRAEHDRARRASRPRRTSSSTSARPRAKRPSTYAETISGSVESGRPTPTRTRMKSRAAELALERLQPVVAGEAAADARAHLAERQVDLVVDDQHPLERHLQRPARRADRAAGVVHVGLRAQHRDARRAAAGPAAATGGAPLGEAPAEAILRALELPALGQLLGDHEADVVPRARVLAAGVAEPDDQPVDRLRHRHRRGVAAAATPRSEEPSESPASAASPPSPRRRAPSRPRFPLRLGLQLRRRQRRQDRLLEVAEQRRRPRAPRSRTA